MKLTANFTLEEMIYSSTAARMKIDNTPDEEAQMRLKSLCAEILQPVRDRLGEPIIVTSGYRCPVLNLTLGGAKNSQHQYGEAADIKCSDNRGLWSLMMEMIEKNEIVVGQLIDERNFRWIHVSLPTERFRNMIFKIP